MVPLMALLYIVLGLGVIIVHGENLDVYKRQPANRDELFVFGGISGRDLYFDHRGIHRQMVHRARCV